ncbi:hypothetical protein [Dactylosporangium salmoneum]|uniref:hypothetical protein n=1 Tax=Dactylosporangium salmoneum TaxID=53361 RepID=UPI0031DE5991
MSVEAELYPEVVAHGTLARAVSAAAARRGVDVGNVSTPAGYEHLGAWRFAVIECGAQRMSAYLSPAERQFGIGIARGPRIRGEGTAGSLDAVVDVAAAWCAGMPLRQALRRFPLPGKLPMGMDAR